MKDPRQASLYQCWISTDGTTFTLNNRFLLYIAGE